MGKKGKWFGAVKKVFSPESKEKKEEVMLHASPPTLDFSCVLRVSFWICGGDMFFSLGSDRVRVSPRPIPNNSVASVQLFMVKTASFDWAFVFIHTYGNLWFCILQFQQHWCQDGISFPCRSVIKSAAFFSCVLFCFVLFCFVLLLY